MITILLFLVGFSQKGIADQPIIYDGSSDIYASEFIFFSTQYGVYIFDRNSEKWGRITHATGLPHNKIEIIGLDEGILWVSTPDGLASADVRINDWQSYELPGKITGLSFDEEYVWVGGDFGIKRFDKYTETWEVVSDVNVNDVFLEKNYIWFATVSGIIRYNREFEKMEDVPQAPKFPFNQIINSPGRIWFLGGEKFAAFRKEREDWSAYNPVDIEDISVLNDSLFVVSDRRILLFEPVADKWIPFRDIEGLEDVNGISVNSQNLLIATDDGLMVYNWQDRSRELFNLKNGLQIDSLVDVYEESKFIFVVSADDIEYYDTEAEMWHVEMFQPVGEKREKILYVDEGGAHARLVKDTDIKLQGRMYYSETRTFLDTATSVTDYENINLKLIGQHESGRLISSYYDDTDKEQVLYGFGYRGLEKDFLYRCNGGFLNSEYFEFDLIPRYSTLGGNARLRYHSHSLDIQGGLLQSQLRNDFFTGRTIEKELVLYDVLYFKNSFYHTNSGFQEGSDTIYIDDGISSNNRIDTRTNITLAGITGDFDVFINGIDYYIDRSTIYFTTPRGSSDIIVLVSGGTEFIVQSNMVTDNVLENVYRVGTEIIPGSFSLVITDTLGQVYPLSDFGIDNDNDNTVDAEFLNHDLGLLMFPADRPFPDAVYDSALRIYTMDIEYRSEAVFYSLSHKPILIGSEKVFVDGELMIRGSQYILDYTSGLLLFLKEDIISDYSEVEVQYSSVEREREDIFYSVQPAFKVGNSAILAPGISVVDQERIAHVSGKVQKGIYGDADVRFVPQIAVNDKREWAQFYSLISRYKIVSLNAEYQGFSDNYESFGVQERKYGKIKQGGSALVSVEPGFFIRVDGKHKREVQEDSVNSNYISKYSYGRFNYMNPSVPNGYILYGIDDLPDYTRDKVLVNANYDFSMLNSSVRLNSLVKNITVTDSSENEKRELEYIVNANVSLPIPVSGDIYFKRNNAYSNERKDRNYNEVRGIVNLDVVPGLYYSGSYSIRTTSFYLDYFQDLILRNYFYNNMNVAPGRWYTPLSIVNFSFGIGRNLEQYIDDIYLNDRVGWFIVEPQYEGSISRMSNINNYYGSVQFAPLASVVIWGKRTLTKSATSFFSVSRLIPTVRDEIKVEFEPGDLGFFITSLDQRVTESYPKQTVRNVYNEWSKPWTAHIRTKVTTNYRYDEDDYSIVRTNTSELKGGFETLLRFTPKSYLRLNMGGMRWKSEIDEVEYSVVPGIGLNLNLFTFLYLQVDYESTVPLEGTTVHTVTSKITGQF